MNYTPEEQKILARCDTILSLEKNAAWDELRIFLEGRIRDVEEKIHAEFEKSYAPESEHIYYLNLVRHGRENFLHEVQSWVEKARSEQERIAKEQNEYHTY